MALDCARLSFRWFSLARVFPASVLLIASAFCCTGADVSYWVWNRAEPLSADETHALKAQGVRELFWHAGEIEDRSGEWRWRRPPIALAASELRIIPVIRLDPFGREPFGAAATELLIAKLRDAVETHSWAELQIDCDTPDRLLASYAGALHEIRKLVPRLTVTALAGWSRTPHWQPLQASVDEIFPMFYDLEADPAGVGQGQLPRPLIETGAIDAQLRDWSACRIPWRAGLPNFARVTVYDGSGKSRGHIRRWKWNDVCFNTALLNVNAGDAVTVLLRASMKTQIAGTPVAAGESVAARLPDRATLAQAVKAAEAAQARGVVYFRLPDNTDPSGWSLRQLARLNDTIAPQLTLRRGADQRLRLTNESHVDIPPRLTGAGGDRDRGYALEVDASAPVWREAMAGDFWRVAAHANADSTKPRAVPVPLATRLTFWLSHMHAGDQLATGLIQTAPGADPAAIRYRILNLPGAEEWHAIE